MRTVQGFRRNLTDALVANCPGIGARKDRTANLARINGYLAALYVLRMESLPPAFVRSSDVADVQAQIDLAIGRLCEWRDSKGLSAPAGKVA
jgi:hypothetical protein